MNIIDNFQDKKNIFYLAKPVYGGWVTFTAHLSRKYNYKLYKIHTKTEKKNSHFFTFKIFITHMRDNYILIRNT